MIKIRKGAGRQDPPQRGSVIEIKHLLLAVAGKQARDDSQTHQKLFWQEEEGEAEAAGEDVCVLCDHNRRLELCSQSPNSSTSQKTQNCG